MVFYQRRIPRDPAPTLATTWSLIFVSRLQNLDIHVIMDDPQSLNWTRINEMAAALTQEQRDLAEWKIANSGKIVMQDFKVNRFWSPPGFAKAERSLSRHLSGSCSHSHLLLSSAASSSGSGHANEFSWTMASSSSASHPWWLQQRSFTSEPGSYTWFSLS